MFTLVYINHRPAFGLSHEKIAWAFDVLSGGSADASIKRGQFLDLLQRKGKSLAMKVIDLVRQTTFKISVNLQQGIINRTGMEIFTNEPKLEKLLRGLKSTPVRYNKISLLVFLVRL